MWRRLALAMHEPDIDSLKRRVPARVFMDWRNFYEVEPWDEYRGDVRIAQLCAIVANALSGKPADLNKYLLFFKPPTPVAGDVQMAKSLFYAIAKRHGKAT